MPATKGSAPRRPASRSAARSSSAKARFWLTYPTRRIKDPVIWKLGHEFRLITNIRQASITDEVGIVCLEIEGAEREIQNGVRWLKRMGVSVQPVELSAVAS